jgi:predicted ATPase
MCWGRCWEEGGAPAFWPWIQVLRELLKDMDPATIAGEMGSAASYAVQILPELAQPVAEPEPPTSPDAQHARFSVFDGIATLLREMARRQPIATVLDDLHAADVPSLLLAVFLARHLSGSRVC